LLAPRPWGRAFEESFLILGWVANWWPIRRDRDLYRRLAAAEIDIQASAPPKPATS
jgi:hypothetical protein